MMNIQNWTRTVLTHTIYVFYMCKYTYIYTYGKRKRYTWIDANTYTIYWYIFQIYIYTYLYCIYIVFIYICYIYMIYDMYTYISDAYYKYIYIIMYISRQCTLLIKGSLVRRLPNYGRWSWLAFKLTPSCQPHHHVNHPSSSNWDM